VHLDTVIDPALSLHPRAQMESIPVEGECLLF
jgi:hypothetical protein